MTINMIFQMIHSGKSFRAYNAWAGFVFKKCFWMILPNMLDTFSKSINLNTTHIAIKPRKKGIISNLSYTRGSEKGKPGHTIQKCQTMTRQNTLEILLVNDVNMIREHWKTRMKMPNICPSEKRHFLTQILDLQETEVHF